MTKIWYPILSKQQKHTCCITFIDLKVNGKMLSITTDSTEQAISQAKQAATKFAKKAHFPKPTALHTMNIRELVLPKVTKPNTFQAVPDWNIYAKGLLPINKG